MMSLLFITINLVWGYSCPQSVHDNAKMAQTYSWLSRIESIEKVGDCKIEFILCDNSLPAESNNPLAEMLLKYPDGTEVYFPLLASEDSSLVSLSTKINSYSLWVHQKNRYYEEENGRTEAWRFEIVNPWNKPNEIKRIELGVYATYHQLNQRNGNDSRWYICDSEN